MNFANWKCFLHGWLQEWTGKCHSFFGSGSACVLRWLLGLQCSRLLHYLHQEWSWGLASFKLWRKSSLRDSLWGFLLFAGLSKSFETLTLEVWLVCQLSVRLLVGMAVLFVWSMACIDSKTLLVVGKLLSLDLRLMVNGSQRIGVLKLNMLASFHRVLCVLKAKKWLCIPS